VTVAPPVPPDAPPKRDSAERRAAKMPMVLGHRGARRRAPENTLKAFDLALEEGALGVELDVRATADGALVIYHDDALEVGGKKHLVSSLSVQDVQDARSGDAQIPTLQQVLAWQDRTGAFLNVELKGDGPGPLDLAERVITLVRGKPNTLLSSFHPLIVRALAHDLPEMPVALLVEREPSGTFLLPDQLGTSALHPNHELVNAQSMAKWQKLGLGWIGVWTVNDPARAVELANLGVDVIISDVPGLVLEALREAT
jgi:glycerophosphoryl diester phosphodiesterase